MTLGSTAQVTPQTGAPNDVLTHGVPMTTALLSAQVIGEYLRWMRAKKLADTSVRTARHVLHGLARRAAIPILEIGPNELRQWQITRAEELAPDTLRNHGSYIRGFFRWAVRQGLILEDPTDALELPTAPRRLPRPIEEDVLEAALDAADDLIRAILALAAFAGLRACEIAGLTWSEVVLTGREPHMRVIGKGQHERVVDIAPPLADALAALPQRRGGPVIARLDGAPGRNKPTRISQLANEYLDERGIPDRLHSLRHRFASRVYEESGGDIRATQEALGHASPTTTAIYARVVRGSVRRAILAAGDLHQLGTTAAAMTVAAIPAVSDVTTTPGHTFGALVAHVAASVTAPARQ